MAGWATGCKTVSTAVEHWIELIPVALLGDLIENDIDVLGADFDGIVFVLSGQISETSRGGVAVFIEAGDDRHFACEGSPLHHDVLGAE